MSDAPQRAFNPAQDDGHFLVGFAAALRIHQRGAVRPLAADVACGVSVIRADLAVRRVAVDHRIHVAGGHTEKQIGLAQNSKRVSGLPVGLGNDADTKALRLEHAADDSHAKARMVHIRVARDDDDVAAVPAQRLHFLTAGRQKLGRAKTRRPVLAVTGQRLGGAREKGDV